MVSILVIWNKGINNAITVNYNSAFILDTQHDVPEKKLNV